MGSKSVPLVRVGMAMGLRPAPLMRPRPQALRRWTPLQPPVLPRAQRLAVLLRTPQLAALPRAPAPGRESPALPFRLRRAGAAR
jgi:hypothetical protein